MGHNLVAVMRDALIGWSLDLGHTVLSLIHLWWNGLTHLGWACEWLQRLVGVAEE